MEDNTFSSIKDKVSSKLSKKDKGKKKQSKRKKQDKVIDETLRNEAFQLGATEEDLELIKDLNSDDDAASEQEFSGTENDGEVDLKDDLQKFMKNIGFDSNLSKANEDAQEEVELEQSANEDLEKEPIAKESSEDNAPSETAGQNNLSSSSQEESAAESESEPEKEEETKKNDGLITDIRFISSDKLLIPNDKPWFEESLDPQIKEMMKNPEQLTKDQIDKLYERGKLALEADNELYYNEFTKESSQKKFMSEILTSGTHSDKISALTLLIQDSPIHNKKSLDTLLGFSNKKSRNSQLQSLNALKDLFLNGLLPDRKLRYFKNQPGLSMMLNKKTLAIFYFEDYLKQTFFNILESLEKLSHDPIIHVRMQTLSHVFDFITNKPEQEFNLLRLGVNKLGDIDSKVSSKASYLLLKLQQEHPNMKSVIINSIVDVALRTNTDYHTTYYAVITLNQTILKRSEDDIANTLIKTYFTLFEKFLISTDKLESNDKPQKTEAKGYSNKRKKNFKKGKNGGRSVKDDKTEEEKLNEKNSKLFSAILTGINRAFPFAQMPASVYELHMETLFKITHSSNFNTSIQALVLINQVTVKAELNNDRYYRTLYESLLDPRLVSSSKQGIYLNLLFKSLKQDAKNVSRVEAFVKRILQVSAHWLNIGTITGFFFLLLQLVKIVPQIKNLLTNSPADDEYQSEEEGATTSQKQKAQYDGRKRDPKFAHADVSSLWEINHFKTHFHPSVQAYTEAFVNGNVEELGKPDLGLFTLAHFLDRFVYRNAKKKPTSRGTSIMQPLVGGSDINQSMLLKASDVILNRVPVNAQDWLNKKTKDIKPEDKFFHQYFANKKSAVVNQNNNDDKNKDFNEDDEMNEDEIWDALVKSKPDVEDDSGDELDFNDEDFSDMDDSDSDAENLDADEDQAGIEIDSDIENSEFSMAEEADDKISKDDFSDEGEEEFHSFIDDAADVISDNEDESQEENKRSIDEVENSDEEETKKSSKKARKQQIKALPTFASADDYTQYLSD